MTTDKSRLTAIVSKSELYNSVPNIGKPPEKGMKLIGVEFVNFACFEDEFVRLDKGLTVLVGRNNSGKTALLRGMTLLADLAIEPRRTALKEFGGYVRSDNPNAPFGINVVFKVEPSDPPLVQGGSDLW